MGAYDLQKLAERIGQAGGRRITVTPETARTIANALRFYADAIAHPTDEGGFTIDVWGVDGAIIETMARASGILVARAAFDQACLERPAYRVTLRQGIRLVKVREASETQKAPAPPKQDGGAAGS